MKQAKGFSLIELMIVVVIVSLLMSVAIPAYTSYVTRGKVAEATSSLAAMRVQMEQYYQDTRTYNNAGVCGTIGAVPAATANFTYDCTATDVPPAYLIKATGKPNGNVAGFVYTVNQLNAKSSPFTATANANGWTAHNPDNCWVTNKGGVC